MKTKIILVLCLLLFFTVTSEAVEKIYFQPSLGYVTPQQYASLVTGGVIGAGQDDTPAISAAIAAAGAGGTVFFPQIASGYLSTTGFTVSTNTTLLGQATPWNNGSRIIFPATLNGPGIKFTGGGTISHITLSGAATGSTTNNSLVYINNCNGVTVDLCLFEGGYNAIYIDGTSFYTTLESNTFWSNYNSQLYVNSATAGGVDLIMHGNRFLAMPATGVYNAYFNGLGSLIGSDNMASGNLNPYGFYFDQPASAFGAVDLSTTSIEVANSAGVSSGAAMYINGSSGTPWTHMSFSDVLLNGFYNKALVINNAFKVSFKGGGFSSVNAGGNVYFPASASATDITLENTSFDGSAATVPIQSSTCTALSLNLINPIWTGSAALLNLSATTGANIAYMNAWGGNVGSAATPFLLPSGIAGPVNVSIPDSATALTAATSLAVPTLGSHFLVSGTTTIVNIATNGVWFGREITLLFTGTVTISNTGNIQLAGNSNMSAVNGSSLTLVCYPGASVWVQKSASVY